MINPSIPESALEHRVEFETHWVDQWTIPNPFITPLLRSLKDQHVTLKDFAFKQDAKNVDETALVVSLKALRSTIIIGVDRITFRIDNPDWDMAEQVVQVFDNLLESFKALVTSPVRLQEAVLVFHVSAGDDPFGQRTAGLVNSAVLGQADFYGINLSRKDSSLMLEPSLKFKGGAFFRLSRSFGGDTKFADIALALYTDEISALKLIGVEGLS